LVFFSKNGLKFVGLNIGPDIGDCWPHCRYVQANHPVAQPAQSPSQHWKPTAFQLLPTLRL
jgi:hypothetical protein